MKTEEYFNEGTPYQSMKPALSKTAVMPRSLSDITITDIASLNSFIIDLGWELINEGNGTLKVLLNPNSQFSERFSYIINRYDTSVVSNECPYQIYHYLKNEGFKV